MELITIGMSPLQEQAIWKLSRCLSDAFAPLTMEPGLPSLHWDIDSERSEIVCHATAATYSADKHREMLCRRAALGIAEYITGDLEPSTLRRLIAKHYSYQDPDDVRKIEEYCLKLLREGGEAGPDPDLAQRKQVVALEAEAYLMDHSGSLHIQGFLTFRLADYRGVLREIVQYAVDEFVMEKQYQDFLALLRYFVSTQEPRLPLVHLVHEEAAQFKLYDDDFEPLEYQSADRLVGEMLETEMQADDRIVSSLIASSPQRILIHTTEPELQVIATIESIFQGRVKICSNCRPGAVYLDDCRS